MLCRLIFLCLPGSHLVIYNYTVVAEYSGTLVHHPLLAPSVCGPAQMVWECVRACVCVCVDRRWRVHILVQSVPHTHIHSNIIIPFEDREPTALKVYTATKYRNKRVQTTFFKSIFKWQRGYIWGKNAVFPNCSLICLIFVLLDS